MATTLIKGTSTPFRGPSESDESSGNVWRVTAEWHGLYTALKAAKPAVGSTIAGFSTSLLVASAKVTREEGTFGTLTVVLECTVTPGTIGYTRETLEVSQMLVERPILDHPALTAGAGVTMAEHLSEWWNQTDYQMKADFQIPGYNLSETEIVWANKMLKGVETWKDYVPVIRRRRAYNGKPTTSSCGTIETPPLTVNGISSYLKTADDATEDDNGNWTRVEEWTGASGEWDPEIYGATSRAALKVSKARRKK